MRHVASLSPHHAGLNRVNAPSLFNVFHYNNAVRQRAAPVSTVRCLALQRRNGVNEVLREMSE